MTGGVPKFVVDASVVLKWILPDETYQENAVKLEEDFLAGKIRVFAPSFVVQEAANALWIAVKKRRIQQTDAQDALGFLQNAQLSLRELDWREASETLALACRIDVAVYDAAYLFLCGKLDAELVTADNKLLEKSKEYFNVIHIEDY